MDYAQLGRTGLKPSVIGLGGGGASRFGAATGQTSKDIINLIHQAIDLGINIFDTSGAISNVDHLLGRAIRHKRSDIIVSTKASLAPFPVPFRRSRTVNRLVARASAALSYVAGAAAIRAHVDQRLRDLRVDYIDIFHLHSVLESQYENALKRVVPALLQLKQEGKIRFIGITEAFSKDRSHRMLSTAMRNGPFDVVMVGFNILNPSARHSVLKQSGSTGTGVIGMFALRRALRNETTLQATLSTMARDGVIASRDADADALVRFLHQHGVEGLPEAAYRFSRHAPGIDVVLMGTGNARHLEENVKAALAPPLPVPVQERLESLFGHVDSVSGD